MQDIINSFKAHLYDRTSSPLVGSFIFYWLLCNYKLVVVLLDSDLKANEKFDLIKTLYPQEVLTLWTGFDIYYYTYFSFQNLQSLFMIIGRKNKMNYKK